MAVLASPVLLFKRASTPTAVLASPVVLSKSAAAPTAVFSFPVLRESVPAPTPVLKLASTLLWSDNAPTACVRKACAGVEAQKGVLAFCRIEPGIAAIRRRINCVCLR